jgi:hypothetical protein
MPDQQLLDASFAIQGVAFGFDFAAAGFNADGGGGSPAARGLGPLNGRSRSALARGAKQGTGETGPPSMTS